MDCKDFNDYKAHKHQNMDVVQIHTVKTSYNILFYRDNLQEYVSILYITIIHKYTKHLLKVRLSILYTDK